MTAFLSDQDVAQRVLEHIANKTTDAGDEVWREPVQNYHCPRRFEDEIHSVLRRYPMPFCPSAALPEAGSYVARTAAGIAGGRAAGTSVGDTAGRGSPLASGPGVGYNGP